MKQLGKVSISLSVLFLVACGGNEQVESTTEMIADSAVIESPSDNMQLGIAIEKNGLKFYKANIAKDFPNAKLSLSAPTKAAKLKAGEVQFDFSLADYELAVQTEDAEMRHCANSQEGQHIHYILNNSPYLAMYEPSFKAELNEGNNVVLAFLSRSYHESIKNSTAFTLTNFPIGNVAGDFDETAPHLFYSRPKGEYKGKDTEKVLLDFYLVNTTLSETGKKVKVTINETVFIVDKWAPYFVEGLPEGENTFRIVLIDAEGNPVPGPFNDSGARTVVMRKS